MGLQPPKDGNIWEDGVPTTRLKDNPRKLPSEKRLHKGKSQFSMDYQCINPLYMAIFHRVFVRLLFRGVELHPQVPVVMAPSRCPYGPRSHIPWVPSGKRGHLGRPYGRCSFWSFKHLLDSSEFTILLIIRIYIRLFYRCL